MGDERHARSVPKPFPENPHTKPQPDHGIKRERNGLVAEAEGFAQEWPQILLEGGRGHGAVEGRQRGDPTRAPGPLHMDGRFKKQRCMGR